MKRKNTLDLMKLHETKRMEENTAAEGLEKEVLEQESDYEYSDQFEVLRAKLHCNCNFLNKWEILIRKKN